MGSTNPFFLYDTTDNNARIRYYGVGGSGRLFIDGIVDGGYSPGGGNAIWDSLFDMRIGIPSPIEIGLQGSFDPSRREVNLSASVIATDSINWSDLRFQCALVENHIHWNAPNGLTVHNQVMRAMLPDAQGEAFSISEGDTAHFDRTIVISQALNTDSCKFVVFVQAFQSKNILQAGSITIPELHVVAVHEDTGLLPKASAIKSCQPNPFNAVTLIKYNLEKTSDAFIGIYNILGDRVATLHDGIQQAGVHSVIWDASVLPSGIYFARLEGSGRSQSIKMMLIK